LGEIEQPTSERAPTDQGREAGWLPGPAFAEIQTMAQEAIAQTSFGIFPKNLPVAQYSSGQGI
jgi:hypothetical protein